MAGGYKSIDVSNFSKQPLSKRFPPPRTPRPTRPNDFFQPPVQAWNPPDIAVWRSNLVALSQRENLYFAAYKDKIHVTIPRGLKQLLPGKPSLIVNLPRTLDGRRIGGTIDRAHPHFVNNILVGDLGSQEILLVACDDGDILAFYTHHMISGIIRGARGDIIKPFLHENVGLSAWGLAIHKRSRLIAAGCNLRQFTVFSPAYSSDEQVDEVQMLPSRIFPEVRQLHGPQSGRQQNAKKTFRLGPEGHNIPSLSFGDDINGQAQSVLAIDIIGNLWIFDIYGNECMRIPSIYGTPLPVERDMVFRGWGLLVLPLKAFKPVEKPQDALGGTQSLKNTLTVQMVDGRPIKCFAITTPTRGLAEQESPYTQYRTSDGMLESPLELEDDSEADKSDDSWTELEEKMVGRLHDYFSGRRSRPITESPEPRLEFDWAEYAGPTRAENSPRGNREAPRGNGDTNALRWEYCMRDVANMVNMLPDEFRKMTTRERLHARLDKLYHEGKDLYKRRNGKRNPEARPYLGNGCAILRTYQTDVELFAPTAAVPRTFCEGAIVQRAHFGAGIDNHVGYVRMNMAIAIPQLSLAIVGQQYGYVALLTLTRLNDRYSLDGPIVSFRVDKILPTAEQESGGLWPRRPLMGIAASPIQMDGITRETARRWRLILHFYDHSIMSYELSRDEHSSDLAVL